MTGYVLSEDAFLDLDSIWSHIAEGNADAADRWIASMFEALEAIGAMPGIGHRRDDLTAYPVLFWPVGSYLILYRVTARRVEIVAITHGARDIPAFVQRRLPH